MITLRQLRSQIKVSQQRLADEIGVSRSTIAMWESGKSQPDNDSLIKLAKFFNVSVDMLLGIEDENHLDNKKKLTILENGELLEILQDPNCKAIYDRLSRLNPDNLQIALAALDGIIRHQADNDK